MPTGMTRDKVFSNYEYLCFFKEPNFSVTLKAPLEELCKQTLIWTQELLNAADV